MIQGDQLQNKKYMDQKKEAHVNKENITVQEFQQLRPRQNYKGINRGYKIAKWKNLVWKDHMLYDIIHMTFLKRQKYKDSKQIICCKEFESEEELKRWPTDDP